MEVYRAETNASKTVDHIQSTIGDTQSNQVIINVSKSNQNDKRMFDVYVSLNTMPQDRLLIEIT